jgi:hypothetical protein
LKSKLAENRQDGNQPPVKVGSFCNTLHQAGNHPLVITSKGQLTLWQLLVRIMPMKEKYSMLTDQLRMILLESGLSLGEISRATGIDKSALSRFLSGERTVSSRALDALGEFYQLRFVVGRKTER